MIKRIEELSMNAWPAFQTKLYDGWVLRFADGYTKRANSVNPLYQSTLPLAEKIDYCEKEYKSRELPVVFKLTSESIPERIDNVLEGRGYAKVDETSVRWLEMRQYNIRLPRDIVIEAMADDRWFEAFCSCSGLVDKKNRICARRILDNVPGNAIFVVKQVEGRIMGCGFGAIDGEYIGLFRPPYLNSQPT